MWLHYFGTELKQVLNYYGPYAHCSLDKCRGGVCR